MPPWTPILKPDGNSTFICQLKPGENVLTFNTFTQVLQTKRILKVVRNPLAGRKIVRINHDTGSFQCTAEHRVFTKNRGYVPASLLTSGDQLLTYWKVQASTFEDPQLGAGASHSRWPLGGLLPMEGEYLTKRISYLESLVQASRVCSVQVLDPEGPRQIASTYDQERRVGHVECSLSHAKPPKTHGDLRIHIPKWEEDDNVGLAGENNLSPRIGHMVLGRWFDLEVLHRNRYPLVLSNGMPSSQAMALFQMGNASNGDRRQTWDRLLPSARSVGTRETVHTNSPSHNTQHGVQSRHSTEDKNRTNSIQTSSATSSHLRNLWSTVRNVQTKPDHLQSPLRSLKETTSSPNIPSPIQPTKEISTNYSQNGENHTSQELYLLRDNVPASQQSSKDMQQNLFRDSSPEEPKAIRAEKVEQFVYDLEVEDNHNFFASGVLVSNCDEFSYMILSSLRLLRI